MMTQMVVLLFVVVAVVIRRHNKNALRERATNRVVTAGTQLGITSEERASAQQTLPGTVTHP
jgi:hypothetical protein